VDRRTFLALPFFMPLAGATLQRNHAPARRTSQPASASAAIDLRALERPRVIRAADAYLKEAPITITASTSPRSAGGRHDFFSEADYWWPDPDDPKGPYIQRDGMTNPDNFVGHRRAMVRLSLHVPALAAAYRLTDDARYARHAVRHVRAWFIDPATRMNPHLRYSQAIQGRVTGRGTGIIDTVHLVEVVRAIPTLEISGALAGSDRSTVRAWVGDYLTWLTTHQYGIDEREAKNNHGTCWVMQVAEFARYVGRTDLTAFCRDRFKTVLVPNQLALDGSFPEELRRTKPYGYSLFNLDALTAVCQILSSSDDDLWRFELPDGRGVRKAVAFLFPYIADKTTWPHKRDVMYYDEWPMRQPLLLFAGLAYGERRYLDLWQRLPADSTVEEVIRNYFVRQPLLWI
jgi:Alginate lyase